MRRWWPFLMLLGGCAGEPRRAGEELTLRVGTSNDLTEPSPFSGSGIGPLLQDLVYRGMLRVEPSGRLEGDLAASYNFSPNGASLVIRLRPGLRFSDGRVLSSLDVVETYRRAREEGIFAADEILEMHAVDEETIELKPARPGVLPAGLVLGVVEAGGSATSGTGPYMVAARDRDHLTLKANPRYAGPAPGSKVIEFRRFTNASDEWSQLLAHNVDLVTFVPWAKQASLETIPTIRESKTLSDAVILIGFERPPPPFDQAEARYALSLAIDRKALVASALRGHGRVAEGVVWPHSSAYEHTLLPYPYDPRQARKILESRGVRAAADGSLQFAGRPLRIPLQYLKGATEIEETALGLQEQLAEFGIRVELEGLSLDEALRVLDKAPSASFLKFRHASGDLFLDAEAREHAQAATPAQRAPGADLGWLQKRVRDEPKSIYLFWPERLDIIDKHFCGLPQLPGGPESALQLVHRCAPGESN